VGLRALAAPVAAAVVARCARAHTVRSDLLARRRQESGAGKAGTIELFTAGGISLSSVPVSADPTVTHKAIYATTVGGGRCSARA